MTDSRDEHEPYGFTESPVIASIDLGDLVALQAAIARLTAERDEARRQCCTQAVSRPLGNGTVYNCEDAVKEATRRGWDCFGQEDGK
jgi:hypothetical protein